MNEPSFRTLDSCTGWNPALVEHLTGLADPLGLRLGAPGTPGTVHVADLAAWVPPARAGRLAGRLYVAAPDRLRMLGPCADELTEVRSRPDRGAHLGRGRPRRARRRRRRPRRHPPAARRRPKGGRVAAAGRCRGARAGRVHTVAPARRGDPASAVGAADRTRRRRPSPQRPAGPGDGDAAWRARWCSPRAPAPAGAASTSSTGTRSPRPRSTCCRPARPPRSRSGTTNPGRSGRRPADCCRSTGGAAHRTGRPSRSRTVSPPAGSCSPPRWTAAAPAVLASRRVDADRPPGTASGAVATGTTPRSCRNRSRPGRWPAPTRWSASPGPVPADPLRLTGDGTTTPVVRAIRADFDIPSGLDRLPAVYREDADAAEFTRRFLALFDATLADLDDGHPAGAAADAPGRLPGSRLGALARLCGIRPEPSWPPGGLRRLLRLGRRSAGGSARRPRCRTPVDAVYGVRVLVQELGRDRPWGALGQARLGAVRPVRRGRLAPLRLGRAGSARSARPGRRPAGAGVRQRRVPLRRARAGSARRRRPPGPGGARAGLPAGARRGPDPVRPAAHHRRGRVGVGIDTALGAPPSGVLVTPASRRRARPRGPLAPGGPVAAR